MNNPETMFELADRLKTLRDEKKTLEQHLKDVNARLDEADAALSQIMTDTETQNFTRSGTLFCLTNTIRASATADRKDALFDALRAEGHGGLIYETVNANSLSAFVKEQMQAQPFPEFDVPIIAEAAYGASFGEMKEMG